MPELEINCIKENNNKKGKYLAHKSDFGKNRNHWAFENFKVVFSSWVVKIGKHVKTVLFQTAT